MQETVLLTLGRLPKALDIAESLSKAGCRVLIAEPSGWHLSRVSKYVDKCFKTPSPNDDQQAYLDFLLQLVETENVSKIIPVSEEALHASLLIERLPATTEFFSVDHAKLRELHDKFRFNRLALSIGLDVPETHLLGSKDGRDLSLRGPFILKPSCTCSGQGFSAHEKSEPLPDPQNLPQTLVQEKISGALKSTFSICHEGRVIGTVVYRAAILSGSVAVAFERLDDETAIETWIESFVSETSHSGFIAFDMMEDEDGTPKAIECNPRVTSGIHFLEREDIARAILSPKETTKLRVRPKRFMYQFWPSLTETQSAVFGKESALEKAKVMLKAQEVNFAWSDPLPLWLMPFTSWSIMKRAFLKGESFGEAATHDIAWFEDPQEALQTLNKAGMA